MQVDLDMAETIRGDVMDILGGREANASLAALTMICAQLICMIVENRDAAQKGAAAVGYDLMASVERIDDAQPGVA